MKGGSHFDDPHGSKVIHRHNYLLQPAVRGRKHQSGLEVRNRRNGLPRLVVRGPDFKAGIPAQVFYEKVTKGDRLNFQPNATVSISTQRVAFHTLALVESIDIGSFAEVVGQPWEMS
ncbi:hypothetical protein G1E_09612 [Pseudomonas sp. TJI-51]|nr:hypothetical protein G1E_09612 [Pseudomonas sp. TJI-51]